MCFAFAVARCLNKRKRTYRLHWEEKMSDSRLFLSRRTWLLGLAAGVAAGFGTAATSQDAAAAWKPKKPVEFVIMAGKGGGADRLARFIQGIIEKHKFSPKPFVPVFRADRPFIYLVRDRPSGSILLLGRMVRP